MARRDAEIAADVGERGTDLLTPDLGGDEVWGGQVREQEGCIGRLRRGLGPRSTRLGGAWEGAWRAGRWRGLGQGPGVEASSGGGLQGQDDAFDFKARLAEVEQQAEMQARGLQIVQALRAMNLVDRLGCLQFDEDDVFDE